MRKFFISVLIAISSICIMLCLSACFSCNFIGCKFNSCNFSCGYRDSVTFTDDVLVYEGYVEDNNSGEFHVAGYVGEPVDVVIPEFTDRGGKVTAIYGNAFGNCNSLRSISIPSSVSFIPNGVFGGCENLVSINIAEDNPVYRSEGECVIERQTNTVIAACNASVIPDGISGVGRSAFFNCNRIKEIVIPETVSEIDDGAFTGCDALERFTVNEKNNNYSGSDGILYNKKKTDILSVPVALKGEITFPDSLTEIKDEAFINCTGLSAVVIPETVERIGKGAFSGCAGLESITLPFVGRGDRDRPSAHTLFGYIFGDKAYDGGLYVLQDEYFLSRDTAKCYIPEKLKSVTVTNGKIFECAFDGCRNIERVTLKGGVKEIQSGAFSGCSALKSVTAESCIIQDYAFGGCKSLDTVIMPADTFAYLDKTNRKRLINVTITGGEELTDDAFHDCGNTEHILLPSTIKKIGTGAVTGLSDNAFTEYGGGLYVGSVENPYLILVKTRDKEITEIDVHSDTVFIHSQAFESCKLLVSCTMGDGVITIGEYAFYNCSALSNLILSDATENVDGTVFGGCNKFEFNEYGNENYLGSGNNPYLLLHSVKKNTSCIIHSDTKIIYQRAFEYYKYDTVEIPYGVKYISSCAFLDSEIKTVTIPESVVSIGNSAFSGCTNLTGITLPSSVACIGEYVFSGCDELISITVAEGNKKYYSKDNCLIETESKTIIKGCKNSTIPDEAVAIGDGAFQSCKGIINFEIPENIVAIGERAYSGCTNLTSITIPNSVRKIGESAFKNCTSLESLTIPESVTSLGRFLCEGCSNLAEICVSAGNEEYYSQDNCIIDKKSKTLILGCKNSIIPDGAVAIGESAFKGCKELTDINIPESVTSIGWYAFSGCTGLAGVTLPDGLTKISGYAFSYSGLTSVIVPDGVTEIGECAFEGCKNLTSITIPVSVRTIRNYVFMGSSLTDVIFEGTQQEWEAITKLSEWDKNTGHYTVHCIDGDIEKTEKK